MNRLRRQFSLALASALPLVAFGQGAPDQDIDYETRATGLPTSSPGRIEVIEFFRYGCPFCNAMEAYLHRWRPGLANDVVFRKVPVSFHNTTHQQLYLTLLHLGEEARLTPVVFDTIHRQGKSLEMLMEISEWASEHGIPACRFEAAWHAPAVLANVDKANAEVAAWGVKFVPQFAVNGKHLTSPTMVGGSNQRALEVVDWLIAMERKRKG